MCQTTCGNHCQICVVLGNCRLWFECFCALRWTSRERGHSPLPSRSIYSTCTVQYGKRRTAGQRWTRKGERSARRRRRSRKLRRPNVIALQSPFQSLAAGRRSIQSFCARSRSTNCRYQVGMCCTAVADRRRDGRPFAQNNRKPQQYKYSVETETSSSSGGIESSGDGEKRNLPSQWPMAEACLNQRPTIATSVVVGRKHNNNS